jgi:hypothetical protein
MLEPARVTWCRSRQLRRNKTLIDETRLHLR